eukprot:CAMPEP_0198109454 /NCGR_PEP_ID=MMETSP1442-20131203/1490_1 /TAXON_ID= /ORGANISM="Craspedostauros australis, Strain CCMP3328" /LENGTH=244 /DNA_ID=CAMNT_0043765123 /DNA_START=95 /DNA_END=829 /DNA_ORIENTATION=+
MPCHAATVPSVALFMAEGDAPVTDSKNVDDMSAEEEIEMLTEAEVKKMKRASNLRNQNGVEYAPWMNISREDEAKIKQVMKERTEARRKRQVEEQTVSGSLLVDSQAQELSGGGLRTKIIDGEVEIEWATSSEANTQGFIIKRRAARTEEFETIASFEDWGPLASRGPDGGEYRFLDTTVSPGGWVYRITEREVSGAENDICQALVEIETDEEKRNTVIATAAIGTLVLGIVAAGLLVDPNGGY